uniref:Uncharacterized protein n=1 Tax=Neobodo designis TaxID=312471 RepID=A0A7S1M3A4_NEODS|mmetsp:Transcript_33265/g.102720  ORF Transcript_33265/g.102720 Transcript_33265/m.102720 type:complete len:472 (+) Transcript_33265:74-1489(+)
MIPVPSDDHGPHVASEVGNPLRRVVIVTVVLVVFVLFALSQATVEDVHVPHELRGAASISVERRGDERVVSAKKAARRLPPAAARTTAAPVSAADDVQADGDDDAAHGQVAGTTKAQAACPAAARARARVLSQKLQWTSAAAVVNAVRTLEQPPVDGVLSADEDAPTFPPHELSAPVLDGTSASLGTIQSGATELDAQAIAKECGAHVLSTPVTFKRFTRAEAHQCLAGKYVLFYGNSNTRTLYTALEALLRGTRQVGRVLAKQRCDNSKKNHSCSVTIAAPPGQSTMTAAKPVRLFYWGYVKDFYSPTLAEKMKKQFDTADIVVGNAGVNVIQGTPDGQWENGYSDANAEKLQRFLGSFPKASSNVWWHTTTRLCEHQPHFTRYKYNPKYWSGRSLASMNAAVAKSNDLATQRLGAMKQPPVGVVDGAALVSAERGKQSGVELCPHYDDPLHHRFLDRELVQIFLNAWCL